MRYCPVSSVTPVRTLVMSAGLDTSIVTPGSTAPDVSRTVPARLCAVATLCPAPRMAITANDRINTRFMGGEPPYCSRREPRALARRRVDYELTDRLCQGGGVPTSRTPIFLQTLILWFSADRVERSHGRRVRLRSS